MAGAESFGQKMVGRHREEWDRLKEAEQLRKQRVADERRRRDDELQEAATPETLRKARECVVQRMFDRREMVAEQLQAAQEIGRVFEAITRTLFATTCKFGAVAGGGTEDWPATLRTAYREHYVPWRDDQGRIEVGAGRTRCELVFMMAVDNYGPRQVADHLRMDQRTIKDHLRESLYRYAELAGWIDVKKPAICLASERVVAAA